MSVYLVEESHKTDNHQGFVLVPLECMGVYRTISRTLHFHIWQMNIFAIDQSNMGNTHAQFTAISHLKIGSCTIVHVCAGIL